MPEPATRAGRRAAGREAGRRREAADLLRIGAGMCQYGAAQLSDGLAPEQARQAALEAAGELQDLAEQLRRLTRLRPADRRALAAELAASGLTTQQIARQLGVCDRAVRNYVQGRRSDGQQWAPPGR
jgi:DNA-binding NarL/FixJ family response regulator